MAQYHRDRRVFNSRVGDQIWVRHRGYWRFAKIVKVYESGRRFCRVQLLKVVDARDNGHAWPEARDVVIVNHGRPGTSRMTYPELRVDTPPHAEIGAEWKYEPTLPVASGALDSGDECGL